MPPLKRFCGSERVRFWWAKGPGHQRDTQLVLAESGLDEQLRLRRIEFVDLNRDDVLSVQAPSVYTSLNTLCLPSTVLRADLVVSMPKVKSHHWTGVTLAMKNMFGVIPGSAYGWPKNVLHWQGIEQSILDICSTVRPHFVIADGIIAMEGNGPLHGSARRLHKIVMADDPVAADFTCARLMGSLLSESTTSNRRHAFLETGAAIASTSLRNRYRQMCRRLPSCRAFDTYLPHEATFEIRRANVKAIGSLVLARLHIVRATRSLDSVANLHH